jgi:choline dehydrogenase-like flavoprotein
VIGEHENLVRELVVVNAAGNRSTFRAKQFVLACGGMENPRMLLNANKVRPNGIGNEYDNVGRYFMEHRVSYAGLILLSDGGTDLGYYRRNALPSGDYIEGSLHLSAETARAERICTTQFSMEQYDGIRTQGDQSLTKLREGLKKFISGGGWMHDFNKHMGNVICDIDNVATSVARKITGDKGNTSVWLMKSEVEQAPNPNSRITLIDEVDNLGLRRINLNWETSEIDRYSLVRSLELMGEEMGRLGLGRVRIDMEDNPNAWSRFDSWGFHHAGTTRMSADPKNGVVDGNCWVHGVGNLHVVGNSVFTTVGTSNPTFTIVALSVRLAGHLKGLLTV